MTEEVLLTCVRVALSAYPALSALPHVVEAVGSFVDPSPRWTVMRAARYGFVRLLDRLALMERRGLITQEINWLHEHRIEGCTSVGVRHAAANGHLEVLEWLYGHYAAVFQLSQVNIMDDAASRGQMSLRTEALVVFAVAVLLGPADSGLASQDCLACFDSASAEPPVLPLQPREPCSFPPVSAVAAETVVGPEARCSVAGSADSFAVRGPGAVFCRG
ncbi:hypothetical protein GQ600_4101 [Phytophthora cactorum]|nr:hypothetical protein GQ600_4101 [Phytophthora cactorum]